MFTEIKVSKPLLIVTYFFLLALKSNEQKSVEIGRDK